ncbi:MAG: selenium metabolism-associated LysR family transcriptional regulator [Chloroflexota bacterium]
MPRLEELKALCQVIEQKSFSRAARLLGLSQPAVSLQVKSLEAEFGAELLHRDGFEITPTESGQIVYQFACQVIDLYERSKQRLGELNGQAGGKLRVGASTGPGEYLLPLLLGQFKQRQPRVEIALRVGDSSEIVDYILQHRLELGFVGHTRRDRHLYFEPFLHDRLVLVVYPAHPWASQGQISYQELLRAPLILQQHGSGAVAALQQALEQHSIDYEQLNVVMEVGLQESTKAAVRAGFGATIISRLGVLEELKRGDLVEVSIEGLEMGRDFYIVYRRTSALTNLARTFLEFARGAVDVMPQAESAIESRRA